MRDLGADVCLLRANEIDLGVGEGLTGSFPYDFVVFLDKDDHLARLELFDQFVFRLIHYSFTSDTFRSSRTIFLPPSFRLRMPAEMILIISTVSLNGKGRSPVRR